MHRSAAPPGLDPSLSVRLAAVETRLGALGGVLVAFSGGADSALVVALAHRALGERCLAAMGISAAYPAAEVDEARRFCARLGVRLLEPATGQLDDPAFLRNDAMRCYRCRDDLYTVLRPLADVHGLPAVCDGTNADDLREAHRPGLRAAAEAGVVHPLAEAGMSKAEVRAASRALGLPTWDKPQQACLSSRIPHGTPITVGALRRVERAEAWLRGQGFTQLRVREDGASARIEVPAEDIERLVAEPLRSRCVAAFRALGYAFVGVDLEGFASGKLNRLLPDETQSGAAR